MKVIIHAKNKEEIVRAILCAIECEQDLFFEKGRWIKIPANKLSERFLNRIIDEIPTLNLEVVKSESIHPNEKTNPLPTEAEEADVAEADVAEADVAEADAEEADAGEADAEEADVEEADVAEADAEEADVAEAEAAEADAEEADVAEAEEADAEAEAEEAEAEEADAEEADVAEADAKKVDFHELSKLLSFNEIPEIISILERDIEDVEAIVELLKIPQRAKNKMIALLEIVSTDCIIRDKILKQKCKEKGIDYNEADRQLFSRYCRVYFEKKGYRLTYSNFLKLYQTEIQKRRKSPELEAEPVKKIEVKPVVPPKETKPNIFEESKPHEKLMEIHHLADIPMWKDTIDALDFSKEKEEVVKCILQKIGYEALDSYDQEELFVTSCVALSIKVIAWNTIQYNFEYLKREWNHESRGRIGKFIRNYFASLGYECSYLQFLKLINDIAPGTYFETIGSVNFKMGEEKNPSKKGKRVKLPCMPENESFEFVLGSLDQEESIGENLEYILEYMGISKLPEEQREVITEIAKHAINMPDPEYDLIFQEVEVESEIKAKAICSDFLNKFARKFDAKVAIKFLDFIKDLQKVI